MERYELLPENFSWMNRRKQFFFLAHGFGLMIIHYLNIECISVSPDKTNSPFVVDADTVLPGTFRLERFQAVARRNTKFLQPLGGVEVQESAPGRTLDRPEPEYGSILKERLGVTALKRPNQNPVYYVPGITSTRIAACKARSMEEAYDSFASDSC